MCVCLRAHVWESVWRGEWDSARVGRKPPKRRREGSLRCRAVEHHLLIKQGVTRYKGLGKFQQPHSECL